MCMSFPKKKQYLALLEQAHTTELRPSTLLFFLSFVSVLYHTGLLLGIFCALVHLTVNPYLSSALVKKILSWGFFAFREHTGSSSGYMKTLLVARIQATCFGKQGNS